MIWIGLTVILAVEIARRLHKQRKQSSGVGGITPLVILGMLIVGRACR